MDSIKIKLETLTPVHVGSGELLNHNYDYLTFPTEEVIAVLDTPKLLEVIGVENIDHWVSTIDKREQLLPYLKKRSNNLQPKDIAQRLIFPAPRLPQGDTTIREQLHLGSQRQAIIPGSSLKGSIRTALLNRLIERSPGFIKKDERNLKNRKGRYAADQIEANYFGAQLGRDGNPRFPMRLEPKRDVLRLLRVGDFYFDVNTEVHYNQIVNLYRDDWQIKQRESSYYECIPKGAVSTGRWQIPQRLLKQVTFKKAITTALDMVDKHRIFATINTHTKTLLEREIGYWENEDDPVVLEDYLVYLRQLVQVIEQCTKEQCVLRVGAGSGWEYMTGAWAARQLNGEYALSDYTWRNLRKQIHRKDYGDIDFPKTRKVLEGGKPLGFVKLTIKSL